MSNQTITLDVREDFRSGLHPCDKIQNALRHVSDGQTLRLLVPFDPIPLYEVARQSGLGHESRQTTAGDWEVLFSANIGEPEADTEDEHAGCRCGCSSNSHEVLDVDARGLVPPQPMVKILEALSTLTNGGQVRARTDRRPVHLYPILDARGFRGETEEQTDGSFITHIRRL
jgi:uncharacterized protein (DUF2249 family)